MIYNLGIMPSNKCVVEENDKDVLIPTEEDVLSLFNSNLPNKQEN